MPPSWRTLVSESSLSPWEQAGYSLWLECTHNLLYTGCGESTNTSCENDTKWCDYGKGGWYDQYRRDNGYDPERCIF